MKKILVLLAVIVASFNAHAGMVRIINTYGVSFTGRFTVNQLNFYPSLTSGPGWAGTAPVTVPATGISFPDVAAYYTWTTGGGSFPTAWGPAVQYYLWGITWHGTGASTGCFFNGQIGSNVAYSACGVWSMAYNVRMWSVGADTYIEIY